MAKRQRKLTKIIKEVDDSSIKKKEVEDITSIIIDNPAPQDIINELRSGECTLFFYKITNGEFRKMRCSLTEETPVPSKYNRQGVIVVWDLDASQWRSFYPNRVFRLIRDEQTDAQ
jgi:hypothetical protein